MAPGGATFLRATRRTPPRRARESLQRAGEQRARDERDGPDRDRGDRGDRVQHDRLRSSVGEPSSKKIPEREERQGQPDQRRPDEGRAAKERREETACGEFDADRGEAAGKHQDAQERSPGNARLGAAVLDRRCSPREARQPRVSRPQGFQFRPLGEASPSCCFALDALSEHVASAGGSIVLVAREVFPGRHGRRRNRR